MLDTQVLIRPADDRDAEAISRLIRECICRTTAKHYSPELTKRQLDIWSSAHVRRLMGWADRLMLVASRTEVMVGTACLYKDSVRKVFVDPTCQRSGIGRRLVEHIEGVAISRGVKALHVQSAINATDFYLRLGFQIAGSTDVEGERFVLMRKGM
jgi:putative acetyltransferase